jgi:hypothetical protein
MTRFLANWPRHWTSNDMLSLVDSTPTRTFLWRLLDRSSYSS